MSNQAQIRQEITAKIIDALKSGGLPPWRKSWRADGNCGRSCNVISRRNYSGVNALTLAIASMRHDFQSKHWGTVNNWNSLGGKIEKRPADVEPGTWGTKIIYWSPMSKSKVQDGEETVDQFFFLKTYHVFNIDQVEGQSIDHLRAGNAPLSQFDIDSRYDAVEAAMNAIPVEIRHGGDRAYYSPSEDYIRLPLRSQFSSLDHYYETAGHELVHFSEKQLGWNQKNFSYSMGELVAEIGACFWCSELGIDTGEFDQNCSYLKGWLESMANDPKFIFQASAQASKAVDYLLSFSRNPEQIEAPEAELVA